MKTKRLSSLLICAALLLTLLPPVALAAVVTVPGGTVSSLDQAVLDAALGTGNWEWSATATTDDTVKLKADLTLAAELVVATDMILDLNGHVLSGAVGTYGNEDVPALSVSSGYTLTLLDSVGAGGITGGNGGDYSGGDGVAVYGTMNMLGGSVTGGSGGYAFGGDGVAVYGTMNMLGGSVTGGSGGSGGYGILLYLSNPSASIGPDAVISGGDGSLQGGAGAYGKSGSICNSGSISGGADAASALGSGVLLEPACSLNNDGEITGRYGVNGNGNTVCVYSDKATGDGITGTISQTGGAITLDTSTDRPSLSAAVFADFGSADLGYDAIQAQTVTVGYESNLLAPVQITPSSSALFSVSSTASDLIGQYGYILPGSESLSYLVAPDTGLAAGSYALRFSDSMSQTVQTSSFSVAGPFITLHTDGISGGASNWVYYGEYDATNDSIDNPTPILWRVLDADAGNATGTGDSLSDGSNPVDNEDAMFLLAEDILASYVDFDSNGLSNAWQGSDAQSWCINLYSNHFDPVEQAAVAATTKTDAATDVFSSAVLSGDPLFFLSAEEAANPSYGFLLDQDRIASLLSSASTPYLWWLRSPLGSPGDSVGAVDETGNIFTEVFGDGVNDDGSVGDGTMDSHEGVRPAFNLNQNAVLFASAAAGGKSAAGMESGLTTVLTGTSMAWKLTLLDTGRSFDVSETAATLTPGDTVTLHYTGATVYDGATAPSEYISAMIVKSDGNILYYGRIAQPTGTNGTVNISIPSGLAEGNYSLKVFSEQYNGDYETDYASAFSAVDLTVNPAFSVSVTHYTITATAGAGGSISPSGRASVAYGNDKTYAIVAEEGYKIEDVLVDGVSVGAVSGYTFENVKKAHTITASFTKAIVNPFTDVTADDWFYENVLYVYENGLMKGTGGGMFAPNSTLTRGMFVAILYRMSGDTGSYTNTFSDVPSGAWYENSAAWAYENDITGGIGNDLFGPGIAITREQLAVMLYRYAQYMGYDVSVGEDTNILSYNDAFDISDYAYSALQWACGSGIINGDDNGNLNPQSSATRAEAAAMLQRFIEIAIS
ncbi:S-layer homology domain-containing protein [Papillibacter cinnamivorans]|uniref:S-layer homology domain-containing protein n=1 Tax=Papillibacter cinnamivorans DSM 12816 TaxID=1122930 RepID=A0A1W2AXB0_9FIRM|nr:S-layer homology domain-containing protein [Papillibacter cinnamivorans]SMC65349.1 S-layer homology domain-containing protein [Papillibacter cinnamivorans DSM 12816]